RAVHLRALSLSAILNRLKSKSRLPLSAPLLKSRNLIQVPLGEFAPPGECLFTDTLSVCMRAWSPRWARPDRRLPLAMCGACRSLIAAAALLKHKIVNAISDLCYGFHLIIATLRIIRARRKYSIMDIIRTSNSSADRSEGWFR